MEKPVKSPGFSLKSKEAVPKTEVLEQPHINKTSEFLDKMKDLKVYLDTSIINSLIVDDSHDYRKDIELLFETVIVPNKVEPYISRVVLEEINDTKDIKKREELLDTLKNIPI